MTGGVDAQREAVGWDGYDAAPAHYPKDFVAHQFDPTALITTLDDASASAQSLLSTSAVTLSGSAFRAGSDTGPWDQLALAPLTCLLYAASGHGTGLGIDWTLEACENVDNPANGRGYQISTAPGWAQTAAWTQDASARCWKWSPSNETR
jgi:hypothetical protein